MALQGTLKDFGIAEILQLIGQQAKSGTLHHESKDEEVHIFFSDGNVVSADAGRKAKDRLGGLLVRAGLLTRDDLARALEAQRRTLRRLGDVLVDLALVSKQDLRDITRLQTTETVYRLFHWKDGTYEFESGEVEWDKETVTPLRAESVLMEGFRRIDEWPLVRKKVPSTLCTFERLGPPPDALPPSRSGEDEDEGGLGPRERRVYALVQPGRSVDEISDLARLGEFEGSKALGTLSSLGLVKVISPPRRSTAAAAGAYARSWKENALRGLAGAVATVAIAAALTGLVQLGAARVALGNGGEVRDIAAERYLARSQLTRIAEALEIYRLERGEYPVALPALVEAGLATRSDLRWPWREDYHYRRKAEGGYVLLPPFE
ncbi:MAG: DUF4388 domain-containing protein [Anaeromyxobacteraceae bacterium]